MVSFGPKLSTALVAFLSGAISLPCDAVCTLSTGGSVVVGGAGARGVGGGAGSLRPQATPATTNGSNDAMNASLFMEFSYWLDVGLRQLQLLSGEDLVGILDHVLVGLEDPLPRL